MKTPSACLFVVLMLSFSAKSPGADDKGRDALAGAWQAVAAEKDGKASNDLIGHELVFAGDRFTICNKDGKLLYEGTYRIDTSKSPATIDFVHSKGEAEGKTWLGAYELTGDKLKICDNAGDTTKPRPTTLATKAGSGLYVLTFRREKK